MTLITLIENKNFMEFSEKIKSLLQEKLQEKQLKEFAGKLKNNSYDISVGDSVYFKYDDETIKATVTEIEDGKTAKVILMVDDPEKTKNKKLFSDSIIMSISKVSKDPKKAVLISLNSIVKP